MVENNVSSTETTPQSESPSSPEQTQAEQTNPLTELLSDPTMLFSFAATQMETRALVLSLLPIFDGHAVRALGLYADPRTGQAEVDLPTAQLAIDCVQFLLGKVDATLEDSERREMQRRLNDLRMNYLDKMRAS